MSRLPVIAIFDIGKTNKKFFLFDEHYRIVYEQSKQFAETTDEDGDPCENLQALTDWVQQTFREANANTDFRIKAINCSAYGASFVNIDAAGYPVTPLYNYLKPYPFALGRQFYDRYGGELAMAVQTASPVLGSLNSGLQLYRLKNQRAQFFRRIRYSLHLPQYISYLFSQHPVTELTSIGCHTALWDFMHHRYHDWVEQEGMNSKFPSLVACNETVESRSHKGLQCGSGLHDSSAALIPYLSAFTEPFVLISTGTWCITLSPFNDTPLTAEELQQDCLCYLSYAGRPVKASRLFAGHEHELQVKRLAEHFQTKIDYYKSVDFEPSLVVGITGEDDFSKTNLNSFSNYEQAYHALMMGIAEQQKKSTSLVLEEEKVKRIFVDGGFANNPLYMHLLAAAFPSCEVFAASVSQATAVGAALAIHPHWNTGKIPGDMVSLKYYTIQK